jgi:hypothetical protein
MFCKPNRMSWRQSPAHLHSRKHAQGLMHDRKPWATSVTFLCFLPVRIRLRWFLYDVTLPRWALPLSKV